MSKRNVKSMTLILFVILIVLVSLSCVSAQGVSDSSANLTKSQTDGSGGQVSVPSNNAILSSSGDKNFTVLQNEIDSSSTGMIQLSSNYTRAPGESNIIISKNFNIFGEGYTIDGNNLGVIFTIDQGCSVLLSNVVLVNGNGTNGGAIYNEGTVNIINSALTSNNASFGGAIYNKGIATVSGSTINENTATMGGAIYSEGYLLVGNSNFENNVADLGGAIYVNAGATLQIKDSKFKNNTVRDVGGAIAIIDDVTYDISGSSFDSNKAINSEAGACVAGGAIYTQGNAVGTISGSTFTENEANSPLYPNGGAIKVQFGGQATIEDCTFIKNSAGLNGGAINAQAKNGADCFVTVNNCTFTENTAQAGAAISALQNHGKSILSVENSFFTSNTATLIGGAVYVDAFSEAQIIADEFTSNTAGKGGAIYSLSKNLNVEDSNFDANTATMGKAIYNSNGALNLNNNTISKTSADIYSVGGTISPINVTVTINGSDVYRYSASETVTLNATVTDVDGNLINVDNLWFILGDNVVTLPASYVSDGKYSATINPTNDITYVVGAALSPDTGVVYNVETAKLLFIRSFNDLEAAINAISANGVLELNEEYIYNPAVDIYNARSDRDNTNRQYNGIFIFKNLTINGNGHFIDASAINRTFIIYGFTSVTIKNVIFFNGKSNNGSAIYSAGNLILENCTFINGTTYYDNSDAFSSGSVVQGEATRYIVINDKASYDAALADPASQLNRYYYAFSREDGVKEDGAPARAGDFVYAHGWESAMTAQTVPASTSTFPWIIVNGVGFTDDLVFKYNDSVELVSGPVSWSVKVYSVPNDLGMTDYRLEWGTGNPGAKTLDPNEVEVLFCNVEGTYTDLQDYIDNTNPGETLVLPYNFTYNPDIDGVSFPDGVVINKEITIDGNGFTISGNNSYRIFNVTAAATLKNITFVNGKADTGGAILATANLEVANSTFTDNTVKQGGGAIAIVGDLKYAIDNCTFVNNSAINEVISDQVTAAGGAIYTEGAAKGTIRDSTFKANKAKAYKFSNGGAVKIEFGGTSTIVNCTFTENEAGESGGAISVQGNTGMNNKVEIIDCNFTDNEANAGGAISALQNVGNSDVSVWGSIFTSNYAKVKGGAIYSDDLSVMAVGTSTFNENGAKENGGAISVLGKLIVTDSQFDDNEAEYGAAIAASDKYAKFNVEITSSTFTDNAALAGGGAVAIDGELTYEISNCNFVNNSAVSQAVSNLTTAAGGAIYTEGAAQGTIKDSTFKGNKAKAYNYSNGGAIKVQFGGTSNIVNCNFTENEAGISGGAISVQAKNGADCHVTVNNCTFTNNAAQAGAAISALQNHGNSTVNVISSRFNNNDAQLIGGAIYSDKHSDLYITSSNFTGNEGMFDDAIYNLGTLTLDGNNVSNIIYNRGTIKSLVNATLNNNQTVTDKIFTEDVVLNATLTDDKGNAICDPSFRITVDGTVIEETEYNFANKLYTANYTIKRTGEIVVSTSYSSPNLVINIGIYEVPKSNATIIVTTGQNYIFAYDENVTVFIGLYDNETWVPITDNITVVIDGTPRTVEVINGSASFNITGYEPGKYAIMGIFDGNTNYNGPVYNSTVFEVLYPNRNLSIDVEDIKYGEIAVINITVTNYKGDKDSGTVVLNISGTEIVVIVDGNKSVELVGLDVGQYTINATLLEDVLDARVVNDTESFNVLNNTLVFVIDADDVVYPDKVTISVICLDADGIVSVTISNESGVIDTIEIKVVNGVGEEKVFGLLPGNYSLNATYKAYGYDEANRTANFTVEKANVTDITIEGKDAVYGEDASVLVSGLPKDAAGTVTATIGNKTFTADVENGGAVIEINGLAAGDYEQFGVTYSGDDRYNATSGMASLTIIPAESSVEINPIADVIYGDDVNVTFTIENQTEITITVLDADGNNITENITFTPGEVIISGLGAGEYIIEIYNAGDENHTDSIDAETFTVNKANLTITPEVNGTFVVDGEINVTFTLPADVNASSIYITVDGFPAIGLLINGTWIVPFDNLAAGDHIVTVSVVNDPNYNDATAKVMFTVSKVDPVITISDIEGIVGETVEVNVTIEGGDATGYIFYDGKLYIVENGTVTIPVVITTGGMQAISVVYTGDDKYNNGTAVKEFNATKAASTTEINGTKLITTVDDAIVIVTVGPEGATGAIVVALDETIYNVYDIEDGIAIFTIPGLTAGNHSIVVKYTGDNNYNESVASMNITVNKTDVSDIITIEGKDAVYGEDAYVWVSDLPKDATGTVTATIGNKTFTADVENGEAVITINGLTAGLYELFAVSYSGDDKYNATSGMATVNITKAKSSVLIYDIEDVIYGADVEVNFTIENETEITVTVIDADGNNITEGITITPGEVIISGLKAGGYGIYIYNAGDENHTDSFDLATFNVAKANLTIAPKAVGEFVVDGEINVTFTLPADVNASSIYITVDGFPAIGLLINDTWVVPFDNLAAGDHIVTVSVVDDVNYNDATAEVMFTVSKVDPVITISDIEGIVGETVEVNVTIEGGDATGYIFYDGKLYIVENGTVAIPVVITTGGMQAIEVTYTGDDKYNNGTAVKEFNATKAASTTEINGTELITTVDDAIVLVTVGPEGATGAIVVALDETIYNVYDLEDGIAMIIIPGLTAGNHTIAVKYTGDNNYNESVASMNVTVVVTPTFIDAEGMNAVYGESAYVYVSGLPEDATGNVTVTIGDKTFTEVVEYGMATVEITDLAAGDYGPFAVSYSGDDKYNASFTMASLEITPADAFIAIIHVEEASYNETVEVHYIVENATNITITIYDADGNEVAAVIDNTTDDMLFISGLDAGKYTIWIEIEGDENHTSYAYDMAIFNVFKVTTKINITVTGDKVVDGEVNITFTVPEDITDGTVSVYIDGEEVVGFTIINGTCTIPATFAAGSHTVIISLSGDTNYEDTASSETFEIAKADSKASINATGVLPYGSDAIINVTLPEDATGVVVAEINGELYASYVENGTATIIIPDLIEGNYTATVTYYGDDKYQSVNTTLDIEVVNGLLIIAPDVFKYYHGPERFVIYTTDYAGNPIDGIDLQITINGVTYNRSSNNGKTSLALNLESGNYTVNVVFNGNSDYEAQNVTSQVDIESTIYAENVVKVFKNGTQYYALFLDSDGMPLANTQITFNINGVFYNRTTNETGWAKLNINLEAGEYVLTATNPVTGESKGTNVTVLSQFAEHSALVKTYGDPTPYVVKIRAKDGSIAGAGEVVTFNINGVLYNRTTNSSGEAKLNINLMPGEFIITSTYKEESVSDIITIKPAN